MRPIKPEANCYAAGMRPLPSRPGRTVAWLALALTTAVPVPARANGRFPAAQHVMIGPGRSSQTIALRTTFGFAVSDDGGATFHWICEAALGYAGGAFDPPFVVNSTAQLQLGLFDGLATLSPDRCGLARDPGLAQTFIADLDVNETGDLVLAVTSSGSATTHNRVYRSMSGGPFEPLGDGVLGVLFSTLEMARTLPTRVYLTGITSPDVRPVFYRSDDGGVTLNELPFNPAFSVRTAYVAGIDPTDPDVVYVRAVSNPVGDADTQNTPSALLRSADGGMSFQVVARSDDPMLGFAISDDGQTVWFGASSPQGGMLDSDGLFRSDDRGLTFTRIGMQQVQCLRQHAGTLYVCGNFVLDHFALGRSTDRGDHFEPVLQFDQLLGPPTCPASSIETSTCAPQWPAVRAQFVTTMDAGLPDAGTTPRPNDCHCSVPGAGHTGTHRVAATLALLLAVTAARRRRVRA